MVKPIQRAGLPVAGADAEAGNKPDPNDLTQGSIGRHLLRLAIPGALTNLMTFSTTLVDTIWLGRVSPSAIAAVATYNYIWFLFALLNHSVGAGSVTLIARTYGAGDIEGCRSMIGQTFSFKLIVAVIVTITGLSVQRLAFSAFGASDEVMRQGLAYSTIMFSATPLMFSTFTLKTGLRAIGDIRRLFFLSLYTMLINLVLDPFMIFDNVHIGPFPALGITEPLLVIPGFGWGIAGAAWASVVAFGIVFCVVLFMFTTGRTFIRVPLPYFFRLSFETAWKILRIGVPPAIGNSMAHIANMFVGMAIGTYGTSVFAGQGVNQLILRLVRMSTFGVNMAVSTLVGQNLGARQPERAERCVRYAFIMIAVLLLGVGAVFYFSAPFIARLFIPGTDPESLETADWVVRILRINCVLFLPIGLSRVARGAFEGSGDTKPSLWAMAIATWGLILPLTALGVYALRLPDPVFVWWLEVLGYSVAAVILYIVYRRGNWKTVRI